MCCVDMPIESLAVLKSDMAYFQTFVTHGSKHLAIVFFIYCQHFYYYYYLVTYLVL